MATYMLVDSSNLFFRIRHTASRHADSNDRLGLSMHIMFSAVNKVIEKFPVDHVVYAMEGKSWRKNVYKPYKQNRQVKRDARTPDEVEEDDLFYEMYNETMDYVHANTNCTVLKTPRSEADDIIARWTQLHPHDKHIILSSDSDFYQLLSDNISQFNGVTEQYITVDGVYDIKMNPVIDNKTKQPKTIGDPRWLLFEKCIRGDSSDNIFTAYPGARKKRTKNRTGLLDAYADWETRGEDWHNVMRHTWDDHNGDEHTVGDDFERNRMLIDLTKQPQDIIDEIDLAIAQEIVAEKMHPASNVGFKFMKFCGTNELISLSKVAGKITSWLAAPYKGELKQ